MRRRRPRRPPVPARWAETARSTAFRLGGPIIKDKLHFFLTYEAKDFTTPNTVQAPQDLVDDNNQELDWVGALTPELRANYGPVANPFDEDLIFAKLDWDIGYSDRLELSGKSREERQQSGAAGVVAESAATTYVNDDKRLALRWEHTGERYFNEATVTYEDTEDTPSKDGNEPGKAYRALGTRAQGFDIILQVDGVDPLGYFFAAQSGYSIQDDITFTDLGRRPHGQGGRQVQGRRAGDARRLDRSALYVLRRSRHTR